MIRQLGWKSNSSAVPIAVIPLKVEGGMLLTTSLPYFGLALREDVASYAVLIHVSFAWLRGCCMFFSSFLS